MWKRIYCTELVKELIWLKGLLEEIKLSDDITYQVYIDNAAAEFLAKNDVIHARSKHIIRYHFLKDHLKNGIFKLDHINTVKNAADGFTKPLAMNKQEAFKRLIGINREKAQVARTC